MLSRQKISIRQFICLVVCSIAINFTYADEPNTTQVEIIEQLPEDFKPAFTRDTVIKLNAIVRRSFDLFNEYDAIIDDIHTSVAQAAKPNASDKTKQQAQEHLTLMNALKIRSKDALEDMTTAATELRNSDEVFNSAILAGMIDFVEDIERVMSTEHAKLEKMMHAGN